MQHKLIMMMGSAPGAGKSTISEFLFDQFTRHAIPTRWIYEEDILHLDAFEPVVQAFQQGQGDAIEALLTTTRRFVHEAVQAEEVIITDSIFPAYTWLFAAGYSRARIAGFSAQLAQLLVPLNMLTIYLDSDVATSLARAVAQRGEAWLEGLITTMQAYTYSQTHPIRGRDDVVAFSEKVRRLSLKLLSCWPHAALVLDTTSTPLERIATVLLRQFGLSELDAPPRPTVTELQRYVGRYLPRDSAETAPVEIRLAGDALVIDAYWPNGCRLIPEAPGKFRLQSTNRRVIFTGQPLAGPGRLAYIYGGNMHYYDKATAP